MIPIEQSINIVVAIMAIPIFGMVALFALLTPESSLLWQFLLSLVVSAVMLKLPRIYVVAIGGVEKLVTDVQNYCGGPLKLYGNAPLCCIAPCAQPKVPELSDIRKLRLGVLQFCVLQPMISFIQLFLAFELLHDVGFADALSWRRPYLTALKVISNLIAMSSCAGFATLCEMVDTQDKVEAGNLAAKRIYVQSFLLGLNLIPHLMHGLLAYFLHDVTLHNGVRWQSEDQAVWTTAAVVCMASLLVTRAATKAFPMDDRALYQAQLLEPML